jgi:hypothetical protein
MYEFKLRYVLGAFALIIGATMAIYALFGDPSSLHGILSILVTLVLLVLGIASDAVWFWIAWAQGYYRTFSLWPREDHADQSTTKNAPKGGR